MLTKYQALILLWLCLVGLMCWIIAIHLMTDMFKSFSDDDLLSGLFLIVFVIVSSGYLLLIKSRNDDGE